MKSTPSYTALVLTALVLTLLLLAAGASAAIAEKTTPTEIVFYSDSYRIRFSDLVPRETIGITPREIGDVAPRGPIDEIPWEIGDIVSRGTTDAVPQEIIDAVPRETIDVFSWEISDIVSHLVDDITNQGTAGPPAEETEATGSEKQFAYIDIDELSQVNMRAAPEMGAEIVAMLSGGAMAEVLAEGGGWLHVAHGDLAGYIRGDLQDTTAREPQRSDVNDARVSIWTDANDGTSFGDTVTVYCGIENLYGWDYTLQWQYAGKSGQWQDVPGANEKGYSFTWTEENKGYLWRVRVDILVPMGTGAD